MAQHLTGDHETIRKSEMHRKALQDARKLERHMNPLSVGMGTLSVYAFYLSKRDDIVLFGVTIAATNETAEVVLGCTIAIPAAVVFFE